MRLRPIVFIGLAIDLGSVFVCMPSCTGQKQTILDGHWRAVWMTTGGEVPVEQLQVLCLL